MSELKLLNKQNETLEVLTSPNKLAFGRAAISAELNPHELSLFDWTAIEEMPEGEPWDSIKDLYTSKKFRETALACLLNGVFTCKKSEFILCRNLLQKYLEADSNIDRKWVNGDQMNELIQHWLAVNDDAPILKRIKESVSNHKGNENKKAATLKEKNIAATYKVVWPPIVQFFTWLETSTSESTSISTPGMVCDGTSRHGMACPVIEKETKSIIIKASPYGDLDDEFRAKRNLIFDAVLRKWEADLELPKDWHVWDEYYKFTKRDLVFISADPRDADNKGLDHQEGYNLLRTLFWQYTNWKLGDGFVASKPPN